jgi:hypothetical protein
MKDAKYFDPRNPGWMDELELGAIRDAAKDKGEVLEVGCYCGRTTRALCEVTHGIVIAIDPLHRNGWMPRWPDPAGLLLDSHAYMSQLVKEYPHKLIVVPAFSQEMFKLFRRQIDVLMIDSSHSYQDTKNEIEAFASLVRDNGVIILDDFDLEPVHTAWDNSDYRKSKPWLVVEQIRSVGIAKLVPQTTTAPSLSGTPV